MKKTYIDIRYTLNKIKHDTPLIKRKTIIY